MLVAFSVVGSSVDGMTVVGTAVDSKMVVGSAVDGMAVVGTAVDSKMVVGSAVDGMAVVGTAVDSSMVVGSAVDGMAVVGTPVVGTPVDSGINEIPFTTVIPPRHSSISPEADWREKKETDELVFTVASLYLQSLTPHSPSWLRRSLANSPMASPSMVSLKRVMLC